MWSEDKVLRVFFLNFVIRLGSDWFRITKSIVSNDYECQNFPFSFLWKENIFIFLYWCTMNIADICNKLLVKIIIREGNFFLSITKIRDTTQSKEYNHPFFVSNLQYVVSESVCNSFGQKDLKFCARYLFNNNSGFFHILTWKLVSACLESKLSKIMLLYQNILVILLSYCCYFRQATLVLFYYCTGAPETQTVQLLLWAVVKDVC